MFSPYMRCPYISQNDDALYTLQANGIPMPFPVQQPADEFPLNQNPFEMVQETAASPADFNQMAMPGDPPPLLSNNPVTANIVLFKELTAYPNYGNPSRNADILYTGNRGTWTFESPAFLFVPGNLRAQAIIRAVLDDHANVPVNRYSLRITINGRVVHNGAVPLQHGVPTGGMFTNWRELTFPVQNLRRVTSIEIQNTSTAGPDDWVAFDWMQLRFSPR